MNDRDENKAQNKVCFYVTSLRSLRKDLFSCLQHKNNNMMRREELQTTTNTYLLVYLFDMFYLGTELIILVEQTSDIFA